MLEVRAFRGYTFDTQKIGAQAAVITPPYDVISAADRAELVKKSPYNMARVLLPEEKDGLSPYEAAGAEFAKWVDEEVLVRDPAPSFYMIRQRFAGPRGEQLVRSGFLAAVRIPEDGDQAILGHERTFSKTVDDRFRLMETTRANLGPIFALYADDTRALAPFLAAMEKRPPDAKAKTIDGVEQAFWRVPNDPAVAEFFKDKTLYIADGHHRYQTAQRYRDKMREALPGQPDAGHEFVLMGLVPLHDPGLKIYPAHRLMPDLRGLDVEASLSALEECFEVLPVAEGLAERVAAGAEHCAIGVVTRDKGAFLVTLKDVDRAEMLGSDRGPAWRDLDVAVLHRGIVERLFGLPADTPFVYEKNEEQAIAAVQQGKAGLAFILNPVRAEQIQACAKAGEPMPQKSTYFFPKLPSGAVIRRLF